MKVTLENKAAFHSLLKNYEPGPESVELLAKVPLVILLGISGGGRNTIINHLVNSGRYKFIISDTTRPPKFRDGKLEEHGVNYYFRSEDEVLADLKAGKFLEAEVIHNQQVSGISIRELVDAAASKLIPINEVDLGGTDAILRAKPDTEFFFIVPPNYKIWMERLSGREVMSEEELDNRLETAIRVLEKGISEDRFTFVINDDSAESARRIDQQVNGVRNIGHHDEAKQIAEKLLSDIKRHHDS